MFSMLEEKPPLLCFPGNGNSVPLPLYVTGSGGARNVIDFTVETIGSLMLMDGRGVPSEVHHYLSCELSSKLNNYNCLIW